jgi:AraC-like DNA-binding protein
MDGEKVPGMKKHEKQSATLGKSQGTEYPDVSRLAGFIKAYAPYDGCFELRIPGVHAIRRSKTTDKHEHAVAQAAVCVIAQGAKSMMLGREVFQYDPSRIVVFSVDVPVTSQITRATPAEPFLSLRLDLDPAKIAELVLKVFPRGIPPSLDHRAVTLGQADENILNASVRLMEMLGRPGDAELLGPLVVEEILIRLLRGPLGARVAQIGLADSGVHGVAKAVAWLRNNLAVPMKTEGLAKLANMSVSSFHQHFKSVTSMSPLQYQKVLRLQEARRLMLSSMKDAGIASREVGYVSASQFSREYSRFFGNAPTKDMHQFRELTMTGGGAGE